MGSMPRPHLLCALLAAGLLAGCGDESAEPLRFESGVEPERPLRELTVAEAQRVCENAAAAAAAFYTEGQDGVCALTGIFAGAFGGIGGGAPSTALCESARQQCEAAEPQTEELVCDLASIPEDCELTASELEACYNDAIAVLGGFLDDLAARSCSELLSPEAEMIATPEEPESCRTAEMKCPGLEAGIPTVSSGD